MLSGISIPPSLIPAPAPWTVKHKQNHKRNTAPASEKVVQAAIARYREVMGSEWVAGAEIDRRLGLSHGSANDRMARWQQLGMVERRPVGGSFAPNRGYEWRWLK